MAFLQSVIDESRKIEAVLKRLGATSKGLHGMTSDVEHMISPFAVRKLRYIATIRNRLVHEENYSFNGDEAKFLSDCRLVAAELATNRQLTAPLVSSRGGMVEEFSYPELEESETLIEDSIEETEAEIHDDYSPISSPEPKPIQKSSPDPDVPKSKHSEPRYEPLGANRWAESLAYIRKWFFTEDEQIRQDRSFFIAAVVAACAFAWFAYQRHPFLECIGLSGLFALVSSWVVWFWEGIVCIAVIASIACVAIGGLYGVYLLFVAIGSLLH